MYPKVYYGALRVKSIPDDFWSLLHIPDNFWWVPLQKNTFDVLSILASVLFDLYRNSTVRSLLVQVLPHAPNKSPLKFFKSY